MSSPDKLKPSKSSLNLTQPQTYAARFKASGLCDSPDTDYPQILVDPTLLTRRQLNVLIEEVFHAHLFDLPERKARKFAANLGKLVYNRFIKK